MTENAPPLLSATRERRLLDDDIRGVPPGTRGLDATKVGELGWHPAAGIMSLPVLTLDEAAFISNRDLFLRYAREQGVAVAPHAKTPMAPDLARSLVEAGAWGTTVADVRQAGVMLRAGLTRLVIANEVGGPGGAGRLAALVAAWPAAELYVFADSPAAVTALATAWQGHPALPPLAVFVEMGVGRAGARTIAAAEAVAEAVMASRGRLRLAGDAAYEGAAAQPDPADTEAAIAGLLADAGDMFRRVRALIGDEAPLILTAGGSVWFDRVVATLASVARADARATLVLRSGAVFFHDHGVYDRGFVGLDARKGFSLAGKPVAARHVFRPALRLWAEVLSRPEPGLVICGMGMRDVSFDQGFPVPLAVYRAGARTSELAGAGSVTKLNDQHAFLTIRPDFDIAVGDVVEFGISHPCTCLDRYRVIFGVDPRGYVRNAFPTCFG